MAKTDQTRPIIISMLVISLVFSLIYTLGHLKIAFEVILGYIFDEGRMEYLNITNFLYCLIGVAMLFVPINILVHTNTLAAKTKLIKYTYYFIGISYLLGNFWAVHWIYESIIGANPTMDIVEFQKSHGYMFNHLSWGNGAEYASFMNILIGGLWILLAYWMDTKYEQVKKVMIAIAACMFIIPIICYSRIDALWTEEDGMWWWLEKAFPLTLSQLAMVGVFYFAGTKREYWVENICLLNDEQARKEAEQKQRMAMEQEKHKTHASKHHHHHHSSSSGNTSKNFNGVNARNDDNMWRPVDVVRGSDVSVKRYNHKIYDSEQSRVGVKISDIVRIDKENKVIKSNEDKDKDGKGEIIWITKE